MKRILFLFIIFLIGCAPVRYVDVNKKHNFYERHRYNSYTSPIWVPGRGVILETRIYRHQPRMIHKQQTRRKHK